MRVIVDVNVKEKKFIVNGKESVLDVELEPSVFIDILIKRVHGIDNIDNDIKNLLGNIAGLDTNNNIYIAEIKSVDRNEDITRIIYSFKKYKKYVKKYEKKIQYLSNLRYNLEITQRYRKMRLRKSKDYFKGNKNTKKMSTEDKVTLASFYNESKSKVSRDLNIVTKKINYLTNIINLLKLKITTDDKSYYSDLLIKTRNIRKILMLLIIAKRHNSIIYIDRNKDVDSYVKHILNDVKLVK